MINQFQLKEKLGEGYTAEVRTAENLNNGSICALKIFKPKRESDVKIAQNEINMS